MINTYEIEFEGRENNAIGVNCLFIKTVTAEDEEKAKLKLYEKYEHIRVINIIKIKA